MDEWENWNVGEKSIPEWNSHKFDVIFFSFRSSQMEFHSLGIIYGWLATTIHEEKKLAIKKYFALTYQANRTDSYTWELWNGFDVKMHTPTLKHTSPTNLLAIMSLNQSIRYYLSHGTRTLVETVPVCFLAMPAWIFGCLPSTLLFVLRRVAHKQTHTWANSTAIIMMMMTMMTMLSACVCVCVHGNDWVKKTDVRHFSLLIYYNI